MEITGINSLWKDYDVDALPFNATLLSEKTEGGVIVRELYFNGFATVDGMVRAFLRFYTAPETKGVVLYMPDGATDADIARLIDGGYSVAVLDYLGAAEGKYTIYPASLADCNAHGIREFDADDDSLTSKWFIWTCIARRAIRYLRGECNGLPLFAFGKGLGGATVYKLCAFADGLSAATTMLNVLPTVRDTNGLLIKYRAALDNYAYAPVTQIPLFMAISSNDEDGSLDEMSELVQNTESLKAFRIVKRAFADGIIAALDQTVKFFDGHLSGNTEYPSIKISAVNSENKLYFNIKTTDGDVETADVKLYAAFCIENASNRNWTTIKLMHLSGGEYMAHVDVLQNEKPVFAFVNVTDSAGNVYSSKLLTVIPKSLGIPSQSAVKRRLIYDGSMGADVWMSPKGGIVEVKKGAYDIDGVSSNRNHLVTFKPGDMLYSAEDDVMLQILVCGKPQSLNIGIFDGKEKYFTQVDIPGSGTFQKFTLSPSDFKGASMPTGFSSVIMLELFADDEFIVSSVLWV